MQWSGRETQIHVSLSPLWEKVSAAEPGFTSKESGYRPQGHLPKHQDDSSCEVPRKHLSHSGPGPAYRGPGTIESFLPCNMWLYPQHSHPELRLPDLNQHQLGNGERSCLCTQDTAIWECGKQILIYPVSIFPFCHLGPFFWPMVNTMRHLF